jgi:hypothetical protein
VSEGVAGTYVEKTGELMRGPGSALLHDERANVKNKRKTVTEMVILIKPVNLSTRYEKRKLPGATVT